jgi:hypothetical protein
MSLRIIPFCLQDYALPFWSTVKRNLYQSVYGSVIGCGLKIFPAEIAEDSYRILSPEEFEEEYEEYRERMRYLYSQIMSDDDLNLRFP